jgi:hypothetical protein
VASLPRTKAEWIARFIRQMARHLHLKASAAAVLVPAAAAGEALADQLRRRASTLASSPVASSTSRPTSCAS